MAKPIVTKAERRAVMRAGAGSTNLLALFAWIIPLAGLAFAPSWQYLAWLIVGTLILARVTRPPKPKPKM